MVCLRVHVSYFVEFLLLFDKLRCYPFTVWMGRSRTEKQIIALTDMQEHSRRRKVWNQGFSINAMKDYEVSIRKRALQLAEELDRRLAKGKPVDLAEWFYAFS